MGESTTWFDRNDDADGLKAPPLVTFNKANATALQQAADAAASALDNQDSIRIRYRATGSDQFSGYYADLFAQNGLMQRADWKNLSESLRAVSKDVGNLIDAVNAENKRREAAKAAIEHISEENERANPLEKFVGYKHTVSLPKSNEKGPVQAVSVQESKPRKALSGLGGAGGKSSAVPDNLHAFAAGNRNADQELQSPFSAFTSAYRTFSALKNAWGTVDASGVVRACQTYVRHNGDEAAWADTVAGLFERAGASGTVVSMSNAAIAEALRQANVDAVRTVIDIKDPSIEGAAPSSGFADDPVNTATGNFIEPCTDLAFHGGCASLMFSRCYNSLARHGSAFGRGWNSWAESRLIMGGHHATWIHEDGRHTVFVGGTDAGWQRATGESYWLERDADTGLLQVSDHRMGRWVFDDHGRPLHVSRGRGTRVDFRYDVDGRLCAMEHERGCGLHLTWDAKFDRVVDVRSTDGRRIHYRYDADGLLVAVDGDADSHTYTYDDAGLLTTVNDADGVPEVTNTYNAEGQVLTQRSAFGRTSYYTYLPGGITQVADKDGARANTWVSDGHGRLTAVTDSDGHTQRTSYDRWGDPIRLVDRLGRSTIRAYDKHGRLAHELTADGADTRYSYDAQGRMTGVRTGEASTVYEYADDDDANPSVMVDPVGGRTRLTWRDGLLTRLTDPVGVTLDITYDAHGDVSSVTNAEGGTLSFTRDKAGHLTSMTTPGGARTTYAYDARGLLTRLTAPDGGVWRYEYTRAGRQCAVTDPLGHATRIAYGEHGQPIARTDPLGRVSTRELDDLGNLASITTPGGDTWRYSFDALSRLRSTTDPQGGVWRRTYDHDGNPVMMTDPTGVSQSIRRDHDRHTERLDDGLMTTTLSYDQDGRVVRRADPDGSNTQFVYDPAGRVVEILDANAGLTLLRRDMAGNIVERVSPAGESTTYAYDACGRLRTITGPDGRSETRSYDADSRLIRQVLPDGATAQCSYDACGRVTYVTRPGMPACAYRYDLAGRLVHAKDMWGERAFTYDQAGQLTAVTNALGGITRYAYDPDGRVVSQRDPLGAETRYQWNVLDRLVRRTDPLGRTTCAAYDAAGRQRSQNDPDGRAFTWHYDRSGRQQALTVDGMVTRVSRDPLARTLVMEGGGHDARRILARYDALGHIVERADGDRRVTWGYDADGRRIAMTTGDGRKTTYTYSQGRLRSIDHETLGHVAIEYDRHGRLSRVLAGDLLQSWSYDAQGQVVGHTVTDADGAHTTTIRRDDSGRVVSVTRDGEPAFYEYDPAGQLIRMHDGRGTIAWRYDIAGRLVERIDHGHATRYTYDPAGQLIQMDGDDGTRVTYTYDPVGRRIGQSGGTRSRQYAYDAWGRLSRIRIGQVDDIILHVDASGLLDEIDGRPVDWDAASPIPVLAGIDDMPVASLGFLTGVDGRWRAPGYRGSRPDTTDPWDAGDAIPVPGLPEGIRLTAAGAVSVDGLEWMGARVYDPATMGFLSRDPLPGEPGSVWASNPYEYAANDPLMFSDPLGLKPLSDEQLQHHDDTDDWFEGNGAWVVGGLMLVGGAACIATGFGGPLGMALLSGGADALSQKAAGGTVDYREVAVSTAFGALGEGASKAGVGVVKIVSKYSGSLAVRAATRFGWGEGNSALLNAVQGSVTNMVTGKPRWQGVGADAVSGAVGGVFFGVTGSVKGVVDDQIGALKDAIEKGLVTRGDVIMGRVSVRLAAFQFDAAGGSVQQAVKDRMLDRNSRSDALIGGGKSGIGSWNGLPKNLARDLKNYGSAGR